MTLTEIKAKEERALPADRNLPIAEGWHISDEGGPCIRDGLGEVVCNFNFDSVDMMPFIALAPKMLRLLRHGTRAEIDAFLQKHAKEIP